MLIANGADPNARDLHGNTTCHIAVEKTADTVLKALLEYKNCRTDQCNNLGLAPLHLAVKIESFPCVKELCEANANTNLKVEKCGSTALHLAVENRNIQIARYLLENGAKVNAQRLNGYSALHMAVELDSEEMVKLLLSYKADRFLETIIDDEDSTEIFADGYTAFDLSKSERMTQILQGMPLQDSGNLSSQVNHTNKSDVREAGEKSEGQLFCLTYEPCSKARREDITELMNNFENFGIDDSSAEEPYLFVPNDQRDYPNSENSFSMNEIEAMDEVVKDTLLNLLNKGEKDWKALLKCLGFDCLMDQIYRSDCPAKALLSHLHSLSQLRFGLEALDYKEALEVVDSYVHTKARICSTQ